MLLDREISKTRGFEGLREGKNEVNFNFNKCNDDRCLVSSSAIAGVSIGGSLGYFSPAYGKTNDDLEETNKEMGTHLELGSGLTLGLELSYDIELLK